MSADTTRSATDDDPLVIALRAALEGEVAAGETLSQRTTLKVGGPARAIAVAETVEDLVAIGRICDTHAASWLILGRGSNMLIADDGWDGVVVTLGRGFRGVEVVARRGEAADVEIGAAEPMPVLANALEKKGLGGMAFAVAIPGAVGGAVRMNAGAHGGQMADVLQWADVVRLTSGAVERWHADDLHMRYRHTSLPDDAVVVRAGVRLHDTDADTLADDMAEMRQWRRDHQPINEPSCGSVFRNPDGDSAGRLIEASGLKGHQIGGAQISLRHANFITVSPGATAADVHGLIRLAQAEVARQHDVQLVPEVVIAGFPAAPTAGEAAT